MKIIFFISFLLTCTITNAQSGKKKSLPLTKIIPGVGVGQLKLGMNETAAYNVLKGDITWVSYEDEMKSFKSFAPRTFAIDSLTQFVLGFDSCAVYNNEAPKKLPVYKLYFKDHKLNVIILTSYGDADEEPIKNTVSLKNGVGFYSYISESMAKMKGPFVSLACGDYDGDHIYYKEGLEFLYDAKKLRTIFIFTPAPDFLEKIAKNSAELKQQYESIEM